MNSSYISLSSRVASETASVLKILWEAGAVFHARTTQPQTLMQLETTSNLYGATLNPRNRECTSGGSSGGEGALGGIGGSNLGIGTDIGGSIRNPAACNGLYGLKPTSFRIPTTGWSSTAPGADAITTVIGPLSTSLAGISLFMSTILAFLPWLEEPALIPLPWIPPVIAPTAEKPLKIGVMWHDDVVRPHPPITDALTSLTSKLKELPNVSVVEWKPHLHDEAWAIISTLYFPDGGKEDKGMMETSGEPILPLAKWVLEENPCVKELGMQEFYYWQEEREAYRQEYAVKWNEMDGMDVILCPVGPGVAPKHGTSKYWGYTAVWNLLDYPGLAFPVGTVGERENTVGKSEEKGRPSGSGKKTRGYKPMNDVDKEIGDLCKCLDLRAR
jgi:amidase